MNDKILDILIAEIRENREAINKISLTTNTLKVKFGFIAVIFGFLGSIIIPLISLMK